LGNLRGSCVPSRMSGTLQGKNRWRGYGYRRGTQSNVGTHDSSYRTVGRGTGNSADFYRYSAKGIVYVGTKVHVPINVKMSVKRWGGRNGSPKVNDALYCQFGLDFFITIVSKNRCSLPLLCWHSRRRLLLVPLENFNVRGLWNTPFWKIS